MQAFDSPHAVQLQLWHRRAPLVSLLLLGASLATGFLPLLTLVLLYLGPPGPEPYAAALRGCDIRRLDPRDPRVCPAVYDRTELAGLPSPEAVADHVAKETLAELATPTIWRPWEVDYAPNAWIDEEKMRSTPSQRVEWRPMDPAALEAALASQNPALREQAEYLQQHAPHMERYHATVVEHVLDARRQELEVVYREFVDAHAVEHQRWTEHRVLWVTGIVSGCATVLLVLLWPVLLTLRKRVRPLGLELTLHTLRIGSESIPVADIEEVHWDDSVTIVRTSGRVHTIRAGFQLAGAERWALREALEAVMNRAQTAEERPEHLRQLQRLQTQA